MLNASVRVVNGIVPPLPNGIGPWVPRSWPLRREHPSWSLGTMRNRCRPKGWVLALVPLLRREPAGVPVWLSSRHDRWLFDPCGGGGRGGRRLELLVTKALEGLFSVASKPTFANKDLFCSIFSRSTTVARFCTAPNSKIATVCISSQNIWFFSSKLSKDSIIAGYLR